MKPELEGVVAKLAGVRAGGAATSAAVAASMAPFLLARHDRNHDHVLQDSEVCRVTVLRSLFLGVLVVILERMSC